MNTIPKSQADTKKPLLNSIKTTMKDLTLQNFKFWEILQNLIAKNSPKESFFFNQQVELVLNRYKSNILQTNLITLSDLKASYKILNQEPNTPSMSLFNNITCNKQSNQVKPKEDYDFQFEKICLEVDSQYSSCLNFQKSQFLTSKLESLLEAGQKSSISILRSAKIQDSIEKKEACKIKKGKAHKENIQEKAYSVVHRPSRKEGRQVSEMPKSKSNKNFKNN